MHGFSTGVFIDGVDGLVMREQQVGRSRLGRDHRWRYPQRRLHRQDDHARRPGGAQALGRLSVLERGVQQASDDMRIEDNVIRAHNAQSHGIYMANAIANGGGGANTYFTGRRDQAATRSSPETDWGSPGADQSSEIHGQHRPERHRPAGRSRFADHPGPLRRNRRLDHRQLPHKAPPAPTAPGSRTPPATAGRSPTTRSCRSVPRWPT